MKNSTYRHTHAKMLIEYTLSVYAKFMRMRMFIYQGLLGWNDSIEAN